MSCERETRNYICYDGQMAEEDDVSARLKSIIDRMCPGMWLELDHALFGVLFGNNPHAVTTAEDFAKEAGCIFIFDQSKRRPASVDHSRRSSVRTYMHGQREISLYFRGGDNSRSPINPRLHDA